jgi:hypothetical protein
MSEGKGRTVAEILKGTKIRVAPETYAFATLSDDEWQRVLARPEASPRMSVPFMVLRDGFEVTLMLDEADLAALRNALPEVRAEKGFRLLTFDAELDFDVYGFLAEVTRVLSEARISIVALSSFRRDHVLVKQGDLAAALRALGPLIDEVC